MSRTVVLRGPFQIPEGTFGTGPSPNAILRCGRGFKSRKERLGRPHERSAPLRSSTGVSNPGRNVWDLRGRSPRVRRGWFQIPEGAFGTITQSRDIALLWKFQIPEGTFGTRASSATAVTRSRVSNPGRNVWDAGGDGGPPPADGVSNPGRNVWDEASCEHYPGFVGVSNPGRNVWDPAARMSTCTLVLGFKSRKERLGRPALRR